MRTTTINKKITLQKHTEGYGHSDTGSISAEAKVFASVKKASIGFRSSLAGAGYETDITADVWRSEFEKDDYNLALIDGVTYRISGTSAGLNDLFVKLILEKK